jgi:hypothetical protein
MINPNGEDFTKNNPVPGSMNPGQEQSAPSPASSAASRFEGGAEQGSTTSDAWQQTRERAGIARERTEFFLRENPVPTIIGALAVGLAIGLAIRYSSESAKREVQVKSKLGNVDLSALSMPFLWPFFKTVRSRYEDTAEVVKDRVTEGVDRLKSVDVDDYVKPLRKKWRAWTA